MSNLERMRAKQTEKFGKPPVQPQKKKPKKQKPQPEMRPRLPVGSIMKLVYEADEKWTGTLIVPGEVTFAGEATAVKKIWRALDDKYREYLKAKERDHGRDM